MIQKTENGEIPLGISYYYDYIYQGEVFKNVPAVVGNDSASGILSLIMGGMGGMGGSMPSKAEAYPLTLRELGGNSVANFVSIYPVNFENKNKVTSYLDKWNEEGTIIINDKTLQLSDRDKIVYSDNLEIIITMINTMIDIITYALIVFTALSLLVSTVMIGIITYVSVVERVKEIGVIRSLGGRKKDVSHLFNAETFIIGLISGIFGILITLGISAIINIIVGSITGIYTIASLQVQQAIIMIVISVLLTSISGLIPARAAARKNPVDALRSE